MQVKICTTDNLRGMYQGTLGVHLLQKADTKLCDRQTDRRTRETILIPMCQLANAGDRKFVFHLRTVKYIIMECESQECMDGQIDGWTNKHTFGLTS